jgi:glycosyltransferase involved in cell wall biosynthesis
LVLAGIEAWDFKNLRTLAAELEPWLRERVLFTGHVEDADLSALYSGAAVFACVSLAEGFGLPLLEAMQCGTPVIAAAATSLPEVVGDAGILVSPRDLPELSQALLNVYKSSALRAELSRKSVVRASHFHWRDCAQETLQAYASAL